MADEISIVLKGRDESLGQTLDHVEKEMGGVSTAAKSVATETDKAEGAFKRADSAGGKLAGALGNIGQIAGGFVVAQGIMKAPGFFMDAAKAAGEEEAAMLRLTKTLENYAVESGRGAGATKELLADMDKRIASGQKLAFTDDAVRDSMQFLIQATGDYDEAAKRSAAAMDLARGANIPLATATKMLGKMNAENVDTFKKLGIEMSDTATEADALAAVQKKFGGQAEAYAKSSAGQMEIFQIKMAEAKETLGGVMIPAMMILGDILVNKVAPGVEMVAGALGPALLATKPFFEFLVENLDIIGPAIGGVAAVILASMVPATLAWAAAEAVKTSALLASAAAFIVANAPLIAIAAGVGLLVVGIMLLVKHWDEIVAKVPALGTALDVVKKGFELFMGGVQTAIDFVRNNWDSLKLIILAPFLPLVILATDMFGVRSKIQSGVTAAIDFVRDNWKLIATIISGPFAPLVFLATDMFGVRTAIQNGVTGAISFVKGGVGEIVGFITGIPGAITGVVGAVTTAATNLGKGIVDGIASGIKGVAGALSGLGTDLREALRSAVNSALRWLSDTVKISIPGFDPPGPGPSIPGFTWSFPAIQFAKGGLVPGSGSSDSVPAFLTPGEFVLTRQQTQSLMSARAISAISGGGRAANVYHIQLNLPNYLGSKTEVAREVLKELRRGGVAV
jgi:hypothetical protein